MPTQPYKNNAGKRIPGVTTVIGSELAWNKNALMYWCWEQGRDGLDFRQTRDDAADLGTLVHALIEAEMRKMPTPVIPEEMKDKAENALLGFYEWQAAFRLEATGSEVALVSELLQTGGTIDYPARVSSRRVILDLKTSKGVYPDHRIQLATYGAIWNENFPDDPITGYHLLQVGKGDGSFHHHYWPSLERELVSFTHLRKLYDLHKEIGK